MSTQTLQVDRDAREVFNDAAIAVGMNDAEAALDVCRKLGRVEEAYMLTLRSGEQHARATGAAFTGRPMHSRFGGRCAVCSQPFPEGAAILYDGVSKRAVHAACGEAAL